MSLHYLVKYLCSRNDCAPEKTEAHCHIRLSRWKISCKNICLVKYLLVKSVIKRRPQVSHRPYKKSHYRLYTTAVTKTKMLQQYAVHMISSWSVTDGVSLSVIKSKPVYTSTIFVDNKLTLIWLISLLIWQQLATASVHYTQVILLIWRVLHLWKQTFKANEAYDTINHFACNFAKCSPI